VKIASISLYAKPEQIGGGHIPSIAFKKWCNIKGIDCDVIDLYSINNPDLLNKYDAIFIASPISDDDFDSLNIRKPYAVMVHAEFDLNDHNRKAFEKASVIPVIEEGYWMFNNEVAWHPCTYPEYLIDGTEIFEPSKQGLIYAARVTQWKNIYELAALSNYEGFMSIVNSVNVYGATNSDNCEKSLSSMRHNMQWWKHTYDINYYDDMKMMYSEYEFYWDVFGRPDKHCIIMKRLNLAAIEALKFGVLPIVDFKTSPYFPFSLTINNLTNKINVNKDLVDMVMETHLNYYAVEKQIDKILDRLI
jgi:hypothetical protein